MKITEFERSSLEGYYISSDAPPSGKFVAIDNVRELIIQAYMAGQAEEGIDPSYSNALNYADTQTPKGE